MKTITVAQLRQNPAPALADIARGQEYMVVRYRQEIARLVPPPQPRAAVTAEALVEAFQRTPLDPEWADEIASDRSTDVGEDPWTTE